jgi:O-antigen/teichoic acid export membrane protein
MTAAALARVAPRLAGLIGGEAMQSAFHLGLNLALLHAVSAREYGIFALVMVIGGLGLTYARSLTALPASIAIAARPGRSAAAHEAGFNTAAALLALIFGIGVAIALGAWLEHGAIAGGALVSFWALRSHLRTVCFARGRERIVGRGDLGFTLSGAAGALAAIAAGSDILHHILLATAGANALGIAIMLGLARQPLRLDSPRRLWRRYRRLWPVLRWSLASVTITNLQGQGMALMVGVFAGPAAYAPIAAVLVIFMPLRVVAAGFANMMHPELTALHAKGDALRIRRLMLLWLGPLAAVSLTYLAAALLALPLILPQSLEPGRFHPMAAGAWVVIGTALLYVMPRIWLEAAEAYRAIAVLSAAAAALGIGCVAAILAAAADPAWAIAGGALSEIVVLVGTWAIAIRRLRARSREGQREAASS